MARTKPKFITHALGLFASVALVTRNGHRFVLIPEDQASLPMSREEAIEIIREVKEGAPVATVEVDWPEGGEFESTKGEVGKEVVDDDHDDFDDGDDDEDAKKKSPPPANTKGNEAPPPDDGLEKLKVAELTAILKDEFKVQPPSGANKADLIALVREQRVELAKKSPRETLLDKTDEELAKIVAEYKAEVTKAMSHEEVVDAILKAAGYNVDAMKANADKTE